MGNKKDDDLRNSFDKTLKEYGLSISSIATLALLVGSYSKLEKSDVNACILASVLGFIIIDTFKHEITFTLANLGKAVLCLFLMLIIPALLYAKEYWTVTVALLSFILSALVACVIIYRRNAHQTMNYLFSGYIIKNLLPQLMADKFFRKKILYSIDFHEITNDEIFLHIDLSYDVYNRTDESEDHEFAYTYSVGKALEVTALLDNACQELECKSSLSKTDSSTSSFFTKKLSARARHAVNFSSKERFHTQDSLSLTTKWPADQMSVTWKNNTGQELRITSRVLHKNDLTVSGNSWVEKSGIMPHHGIVLHWKLEGAEV